MSKRKKIIILALALALLILLFIMVFISKNRMPILISDNPICIELLNYEEGQRIQINSPQDIKASIQLLSNIEVSTNSFEYIDKPGSVNLGISIYYTDKTVVHCTENWCNIDGTYYYVSDLGSSWTELWLKFACISAPTSLYENGTVFG